jgi:hypothetical protein
MKTGSGAKEKKPLPAGMSFTNIFKKTQEEDLQNTIIRL